MNGFRGIKSQMPWIWASSYFCRYVYRTLLPYMREGDKPAIPAFKLILARTIHLFIICGFIGYLFEGTFADVSRITADSSVAESQVNNTVDLRWKEKKIYDPTGSDSTMGAREWYEGTLIQRKKFRPDGTGEINKEQISREGDNLLDKWFGSQK